ncbi:MAG: hypothetical protein A3H69_05660 [Candidatus Sungbacteria bacterium RIFCSPLOWO2_02_FULL_47_9]|nr:MAG: hypothetical protein UX72_C0005G0065 [Parcubacteria group bacterium GW2011_GWA2_47_10]OGZ98102.1 MAG: hypothetical protein A3D57_00500 [Candidatus Sungbacteria bacterium RIFCSPHIGHO2_02_FULL_46_12]OHA05959.1 MAG: hypothetical protein A3A28_03415 [Candidatus Sungbacteria bacterium RIFCSPLOWO2_01_FULL_47_32]OHA09918.1 MAG: hypothetical protein A3H69_05660 [Candidatus Sungbacteria bacterium RIFCSPLOWO2_02_FULL_47_9]
MNEEIPKFRPNVPEEVKATQLDAFLRAKKRIEEGEVKGEIEHDMEYFRVGVSLKGGQKITENIPKNAGGIRLDKEGAEVSPEEAVEAVQRFYPELEESNLKEAVRRLRESKLKK